MNLNQLTISKAYHGLKKKEFSAVELTKACLERIKKTDKKVKAFITVCDEIALAKAKSVDHKIKAGENIGPLEGIPCAVKDNIVTQDILSTAGSNILNNYIPPYDAAIVKRLKKAGAVIIGKTNCDAFGHGVSTENSDFFTTHNPWDLDRVPGGSSGGSAAAVLADETIYALGTDTGGSIRQPANFCGVVGLKPTYGRVSRYGLISMTSSTDCPGAITKTVEDAAIILEYLAGQDKKDATTSPKKIDDYWASLKKTKVAGLKIGVPKEYFVKGIAKDVAAVVRQVIDKFLALGAEIVDLSLPHTKYAVPVYYIITPSEISANLSRYDGIKYGYSEARRGQSEARSLLDVYLKSRAKGFGDEAKRRIMLGTYVLSAGYYDAYYLQASKVRTLIKQDFETAFKNVDVILTPISPHTAFKIGEQITDPLAMYLEDIFTTAVSLAGLPAISIPAGFSNDLPVGVQLIGKHFDETKILQTAYAYEQATDWHTQKPKI